MWKEAKTIIISPEFAVSVTGEQVCVIFGMRFYENLCSDLNVQERVSVIKAVALDKLITAPG